MTNSIIKTDKIRVLAESMVELRQSLLYLIEANDPHGLTKNDHDEIVAIVIAAIEGSLQTIELNQAEDVLGRMVERVEALGSAIFRDVNSPSKTNTIFDTAVRAANAPLRDGRSIHLELGTYSVWPDERADRYVRDEKIGDVIRLDMSLDYPVDVGASVTAMPFADESIDRIYSNSLFEHCAYPHEIIREAFRILRPGGVFLTAVPFHFVQHGCPRDYLRFTGDFFEDVCSDVGFDNILVDTTSTSGVYYTTHQLGKSALPMGLKEHPAGPAAIRGHMIVTTILAAMQGLDFLFHAHGASHWHTTNMIALKPGRYVSRLEQPNRTLPFLERFNDLVCPRSGLPLVMEGQKLVSLDGVYTYPIENGVPNLFVIHGFGSSFQQRASSRERLERHLNKA